MGELRRGKWGLLGGDYGVLGAFLLDYQPLEEFLKISFEEWGLQVHFLCHVYFG